MAYEEPQPGGDRRRSAAAGERGAAPLPGRGRRDPGRGLPRARAPSGRRLIDRYAAWAAPFDAVLTPPATGEAPGPETTGDPRFCTRWTLLGAPAIVLPTGLGPHGLPLGLQLAGAQGDDRRLLQTAGWVERVLAPR